MAADLPVEAACVGASTAVPMTDALQHPTGVVAVRHNSVCSMCPHGCGCVQDKYNGRVKDGDNIPRHLEVIQSAAADALQSQTPEHCPDQDGHGRTASEEADAAASEVVHPSSGLRPAKATSTGDEALDTSGAARRLPCAFGH